MSITKDSVTRRYIYKDQVDEISLKMKKGSVVLHGGRGVGKTTVCLWIQEKLSDTTVGANVLIVNGRDPARAEQDLESIAGNQVILIDNLDVLLISVKHNEDLLKRVVTKVSALIPTVEQIKAGSRLLVTTTIDLWRLGWSWLKGVELPEWWNAYSSFVQQSTQIRLDPWPLYWQSVWEQDFNDEFAETMDADVLELWCTAIIELTGGHPALYGPALEQLRILSNKQELSDSADARMTKRASLKHKQELNANIRRYLEDHIARRGVPKIKSAILRLSRSSDESEQRAFRELASIAKDGREKLPPPSDQVVRAILEEEALLYRDKIQGLYSIPGTIIRRHILETGSSPKTSLSLVSDPQNPEIRGELRVNSNGGEERISLSGAPWRVLRLLYENHGQIVPTEQLAQRSGLVRKDALRNAIQRLQNKLKEKDISDIIENQYGWGYRIVR